MKTLHKIHGLCIKFPKKLLLRGSVPFPDSILNSSALLFQNSGSATVYTTFTCMAVLAGADMENISALLSLDPSSAIATVKCPSVRVSVCLSVKLMHRDSLLTSSTDTPRKILGEGLHRSQRPP